MKLTIHDIELPEQRTLVTNYIASERIFSPLTKHIVQLRRRLRKGILDSKDDDERIALHEQYWKDLVDSYTVERDLHESARLLLETNGIDAVDMMGLYKFLQRTAPLNQLEFSAVHYRTIPWVKDDITNSKEYFNSWWPFVFIELKEDPRDVIEGVKFVNITNSTKIREKDWHKMKELQGIHIIRRCGEISSGDVELGGLNVIYMYVKDNPSDRTKTVFCFGMPSMSKKPEIRVYPLVVNVGDESENKEE